MNVSVIILSFNRPDYFRKAIASIQEQTCQIDEIIVVDNPSPASGLISSIVSNVPGAKVVRPPKNIGFTGGMNLGVRCARSSHVLLTEDDIVLDRSCLQSLVDASRQRPGLRLFGPRMYKYGSGVPHFARGSILRQHAFRLEVEPDVTPESDVYTTGYLSGAVVFGERRILSALGPFRPEFFMYCEDVELSLRVLSAGGTLHIVDGAKVFHFEPPTSQGTSPLIEFHKHKNRLALHILHREPKRLMHLIGSMIKLAARQSIQGNFSAATPTLRALGWFGINAARLMQIERKSSTAATALRRSCTS